MATTHSSSIKVKAPVRGETGELFMVINHEHIPFQLIFSGKFADYNLPEGLNGAIFTPSA